MTDFWAVIPARRASSRLPDKALADIGGKPMVVRVAERAAKSKATRVVVATDCNEIFSCVREHGVEAVLTSASHASGTDRLAEAVRVLKAHNDQIVVNVQGDEPLIDPQLIHSVAQALATAAHPISDSESIRSPHVVKVVCNSRAQALYFSRAPIPYQRDAWPNLTAISQAGAHALLRHIGIYGFRAKMLAEFVQWGPCELEQTEQLEQLRWLWHGHAIAVHQTPSAPHAGVDTQQDLDRVRALWAALAQQGSL